MMLWRVDDVMTRDVVAVREDTPYRDVVDLLIGHRVSAVPVVDVVDHVVGVVSEADLLLKMTDVAASKVFVTWRSRRDRRKAHGRLARDVMSAPAVTVMPSLSVAAAARRMQREHVKRLPVEDNLGRLVGIVTRSDLLKVQLRTDAEIREDVIAVALRDVSAVERGELIVKIADGVVTLGGRLHFRSAVDGAVRASSTIPGVVDVVDEVAYDIDDRLAVGSETGAPFGVA
jgi:CBS domain-containing protein